MTARVLHGPTDDPIGIDELIERLRLLGHQWADADAAANLLEDTRKTVLAELMRQVPGKSHYEREMHALSHPTYGEHLRATSEARRKANRARVSYQTEQARIELIRTAESTRRAQMAIR
ncbi:MAG: hypothetical protein ACK53W_13390 [Gemmatimonadota bacterium]|jgi:hypothetical protein